MLTPSEDEGIIDQESIAKQVSFVGEFPYDTIKEGLKDQFSNYMSTEDSTDYVDIFYNQLEASYLRIKDDNADLPMDDRELMTAALDEIHNDFISYMAELFNQTLTITFREINNEEISYDGIKSAFSAVYDFFILNARNNFIKALSNDIVNRLRKFGDIRDDEVFFHKINDLMPFYDPIIVSISPNGFIDYLANDDLGESIREMYNDGVFLGNFLRRYSPKLYKNSDFKSEIISNVTMLYDLGEEFNHAG
jgi:hypothetical protein